MKKILWTILFAFFLASPCLASEFSIKSVSWQDGQTMADKFVFNSFGCTGGNVSPQIFWEGGGTPRHQNLRGDRV